MLKLHEEEFGDAVVLHLHGHIVQGAETANLRNAVLLHRDAKIVVLDLARVDVVDAGGLGALLELREWTHAKGIKFRLLNVTRPVREVFEISCLDSVFDISFQEDARSAQRNISPAIIAAPLKVVERRS